MLPRSALPAGLVRSSSDPPKAGGEIRTSGRVNGSRLDYQRSPVGDHRDLRQFRRVPGGLPFSDHRPDNGMFGLPADGKPVAFTGNAILAVTPDGQLAPKLG